jgi:hypothetical protein
MERNSTSFILCFVGWSTNLWWNAWRSCSGVSLEPGIDYRHCTISTQMCMPRRKPRNEDEWTYMIDITFWLIESKSKVYAVYWMEPFASQLIKSSKRLLELTKLYICKTWEFRQTHCHWSASLVREDEDQIAITLLWRLTHLRWTAWAWLCIHNTPLLVLISGNKFIWVVGLLDGTISIAAHEIKQEAIAACEIVYL